MGKLNNLDSEKGILIVDDNEDIIFAYNRYLQRKGFKKIFTATTREKSYQIIRNHIDEIEVVVLDWILDDHKDCREIVTFLNNFTNKRLSLIFMSTKVDVPKEYYSHYISENLEVVNFFTDKDVSILFEQIMEILAKQRKKMKSIKKCVTTSAFKKS